MAVLLSRLSLVVLFSYIVSITSLTCPNGAKPLPPSSCVQVVTGPSDQASACSEVDSSNGPVQLSSVSQFDLLVRYAQVVTRLGKVYWMGYSFSSSDDLGDVPSDIEDVLLDDSNYGMGDQADAGSGVCLAMGQDGKLYRRECTTLLPALCYQMFEAPSASLNFTGDRFVTVGSGIGLTCTTSEGSEVTWRAATPGTSQPEVIEPPNISSFDVSDAGAYYCIASNSLGGYVSNSVVLVPSHTGVDRDPTAPDVTLSSDPAVGQFGGSLTLTCSYTSSLTVSNVQWFINGIPASETSRVDQASSTLVIDNLQEEGYYQCFIRTENGNVESGSMLVSAQAGSPSEVDEVTALPYTQRSILVTWLCPLMINIHDTALLRYRVSYQPGFDVDTGSADSVDDLPPRLLNGSESSICLAQAVIPNLNEGTTYAVKVVAIAPGSVMGEVADKVAVTTTFGTSPGMVEKLTVERSPDNKTVFASWVSLTTSPPMGVVSRYKIEYRDNEKNSVSTVFHSANFNYLVVTNVINANTYEVRVSGGVVIQRDPLDFAFGEFTPWMKVEGINDMIPSVAPTAPLNTEPAAGVIAAGVTVGVLSFIIVMAILIVGLFCCFYKKSTKQLGEDGVKLSSIKNDPEVDPK